MARQKAPEEPEDDVPAWVMTFSDVITLLMTFFILLLTFATNQPETFDRMQVAMFGGGGADGFAGSSDGMDKDDLLLRERSRAGRTAPDGSKIPPIHSDPALSKMDKGISGLELDEYRTLSTTHHVVQSIRELFKPNGDLSALQIQQLRLLGRQIRKRPLRIEFIVHGEAQLPFAIKIVDHLTGKENLPSASLGVGIGPNRVNKDQILMVISNQGVDRGTKD